MLVKSAIVPFWMDSTVTLSLRPWWAPFPVASVGGTQPTVAAVPRPRCVPGGVRPLGPGAAADWLAGGGAAGASRGGGGVGGGWGGRGGGRGGGGRGGGGWVVSPRQ